MKNELENLIAIAKEWSEFTRADGRGHKKYFDEYISCYHAHDSNHRQVEFGNYPHRLEITFHETPIINGSVKSLTEVKEITENAARLLSEHKAKIAQQTTEEQEAERQKKIKILQEQLTELQS